MICIKYIKETCIRKCKKYKCPTASLASHSSVSKDVEPTILDYFIPWG